MPSSSPQDESNFTLTQQVAITLAPTFSKTRIRMLAENRDKHKCVKYRFLFALCFCGVFNSLTFVFWSLPISKGTSGVWGAMTREQSVLQRPGFLHSSWDSRDFLQLRSVFVLLCKSLGFHTKDEQIAKRYEKWI
jgi:hypothetical protein